MKVIDLLISAYMNENPPKKVIYNGVEYEKYYINDTCTYFSGFNSLLGDVTNFRQLGEDVEVVKSKVKRKMIK